MELIDMQLLNISNYYALYATENCNFKCSYCVAHQRRRPQLTSVERNTQLITDLLNEQDDGLLTISGGEPAVARNILNIITGLKKHKILFFTNMSLLPDWYFNERCSFFIATYHHECMDEKLFIKNVLLLTLEGKKVIVKIILKPEQKSLENSLPLWEKFWKLNIPAHFVPLEYNYYFDESMIKSIKYDYLTSCMYNARFFRPEPIDISPTPCIGGTSKMFEIRSDASLGRCSSANSIRTSTVFSPVFDDEPQMCTRNDCFCEWHHFAGVSRANENERWTTFFETGAWQMPTVQELTQFITDMQWNQRGRVAKR